MLGQHSSDQVVALVQLKASRYLEACCILDGVSNLEERLSDDLGPTKIPSARLRMATTPGPSKDSKPEKLHGALAIRSSTKDDPTPTPVGLQPELQSAPKASNQGKYKTISATPPYR
jgi:hypothetical protein